MKRENLLRTALFLVAVGLVNVHASITKTYKPDPKTFFLQETQLEQESAEQLLRIDLGPEEREVFELIGFQARSLIQQMGTPPVAFAAFAADVTPASPALTSKTVVYLGAHAPGAGSNAVVRAELDQSGGSESISMVPLATDPALQNKQPARLTTIGTPGSADVAVIVDGDTSLHVLTGNGAVTSVRMQNDKGDAAQPLTVASLPDAGGNPTANLMVAVRGALTCPPEFTAGTTTGTTTGTSGALRSIDWSHVPTRALTEGTSGTTGSSTVPIITGPATASDNTKLPDLLAEQVAIALLGTNLEQVQQVQQGTSVAQLARTVCQEPIPFARLSQDLAAGEWVNTIGTTQGSVGSRMTAVKLGGNVKLLSNPSFPGIVWVLFDHAERGRLSADGSSVSAATDVIGGVQSVAVVTYDVDTLQITRIAPFVLGGFNAFDVPPAQGTVGYWAAETDATAWVAAAYDAQLMQDAQGTWWFIVIGGVYDAADASAKNRTQLQVFAIPIVSPGQAFAGHAGVRTQVALPNGVIAASVATPVDAATGAPVDQRGHIASVVDPNNPTTPAELATVVVRPAVFLAAGTAAVSAPQFPNASLRITGLQVNGTTVMVSCAGGAAEESGVFQVTLFNFQDGPVWQADLQQISGDVRVVSDFAFDPDSGRIFYLSTEDGTTGADYNTLHYTAWGDPRRVLAGNLGAFLAAQFSGGITALEFFGPDEPGISGIVIMAVAGKDADGANKIALILYARRDAGSGKLLPFVFFGDNAAIFTGDALSSVGTITQFALAVNPTDPTLSYVVAGGADPFGNGVLLRLAQPDGLGFDGIAGINETTFAGIRSPRWVFQPLYALPVLVAPVSALDGLPDGSCTVATTDGSVLRMSFSQLGGFATNASPVSGTFPLFSSAPTVVRVIGDTVIVGTSDGVVVTNDLLTFMPVSALAGVAVQDICFTSVDDTETRGIISVLGTTGGSTLLIRLQLNNGTFTFIDTTPVDMQTCLSLGGMLGLSIDAMTLTPRLTDGLGDDTGAIDAALGTVQGGDSVGVGAIRMDPFGRVLVPFVGANTPLLVLG